MTCQNDDEGSPRMLIPNCPHPLISDLLDLIIRKTYHDLYVACDLLARDNDFKRKLFLVEFSQRTRILFIRVLVLLRFTSSSSKIGNCFEMRDFLYMQTTYFTETANSLASLSRELIPKFKVPSFFIPTAIDVLTRGKYTRLPNCIKDLFSTPTPLTDREKLYTKLVTNSLIRSRIALSVVPNAMRNFTIECGRITFVVQRKFKISLTMFNDSYPWKIVSLSFDSIPEQNKFHSLQISFLSDALQTRILDCTNPLEEIYSFLNCMYNSLKMELMFQDVLKLQDETVGDNLSVERYTYGEELIIGYWIQRRTLKDDGRQTPMFIAISPANNSNLICTNLPPFRFSTPTVMNIDLTYSFEPLLKDVIELRSLDILTDLLNHIKFYSSSVQPRLVNKRGEHKLLLELTTNLSVCCFKLFVYVDYLTGMFVLQRENMVDPSLADRLTSSLNSYKFDTFDEIITQIKCWLLKNHYSTLCGTISDQIGSVVRPATTSTMNAISDQIYQFIAEEAELGGEKSGHSFHPVTLVPFWMTHNALGTEVAYQSGIMVYLSARGGSDRQKMWRVSYLDNPDKVKLLSMEPLDFEYLDFPTYLQLCHKYVMLKLSDELSNRSNFCLKMIPNNSMCVSRMGDLPKYEADVTFLMKNGGYWQFEFKSKGDTILISKMSSKRESHVHAASIFMETYESIGHFKNLERQIELLNDPRLTIKHIDYTNSVMTVAYELDKYEKYSFAIVWNSLSSLFTITHLSHKVCEDVTNLFDPKDSSFKSSQLNMACIRTLSISLHSLLGLRKLANYSEFIGGLCNNRKIAELHYYFKLERISPRRFKLDFRSAFCIELSISPTVIVIRQGTKVVVPYWRTFMSRFDSACKNYLGTLSNPDVTPIPSIKSINQQHSVNIFSPQNALNQSVSIPSVASAGSPLKAPSYGHLFYTTEHINSVPQHFSPSFDVPFSPSIKMRSNAMVESETSITASVHNIQVEKLQQLPTTITRAQFDLLLCSKSWILPQDIGEIPIEWSCPLLFHFFVCIIYRHWILNYSRDEMKFFNLIRYYEDSPNSPEVVCLKSEFMTLKFSFGVSLFPFITIKVVPNPESNEFWPPEQLRSVEEFFMTHVLCFPYSHQLLACFFRLMGAPRKLLRDIVAIIHDEKTICSPPWEFRFIIIFPDNPIHAGNLVCSPAIYTRSDCFFLFRLRYMTPNCTAHECPVYIPIKYDMDQNIVSISDHPTLPNSSYLKPYLPQIAAPPYKSILYESVSSLVHNFCLENP